MRSRCIVVGSIDSNGSILWPEVMGTRAEE